MKVERNIKPIKRSKTSGTGYFYVLLIIALVVFAGTMFSGGFVPVNPNGPEGPPTLPPYFGTDGNQEEQKIIYPQGALTPNPKGNLQLQTFNVNLCAPKSAIDILIDTSGSMADDNKIGKLKEALTALTQILSPKSAISIQTFSKVVTEEVPWGLYKDNNAQVQTTINNLTADGWTRMKDGFALSRQNLSEAITQNKFPGYNYALLLISDGVPEIPPDQPRTCYIEVYDPRTAPALRCFAKEQDPRIPTNLPQEIKDLGAPIYVIGLYSNNTSDKQLQTWLEPLLKNDIASKPTSTYYSAYNSIDSTEKLKAIFNNIVAKMCENQIQ
jgi:hypothetical protein